MTKTQKILVIVSAITISVFVGGALYLYFNRNSILKKMRNGESVVYSANSPIMEDHDSKEYSLKYDKSKSSIKKVLDVSLKGESIGEFYLDGDKVVYKSKGDGVVEKIITNKDEVKLLKFLLKKL